MTVANSYVRGMHDTRPWGTWEVIEVGDGFCVKHICVVPGGVLSLQSHEFRSEHWVIVRGVASVTLDKETSKKIAGEHVYIPKQMKHQIRNVGNGVLEFIEVQQGDRLDENDITRYEDIYGRV